MKAFIQIQSFITNMGKCSLHKNGIQIDAFGKVQVCCQIVPHFDVNRPLYDDVSSWNFRYKKNGNDILAYEKSKTEWMPGCHGCRLDEERFNHSSRRIANTDCKHVPEDDNSIVFAIINSSNLCNLACKMCDSGPSSRWASIARHHPNKWIEDDGLIEHNYMTQGYIKKYVLNPNLRKLSFAGGEPFMSKIVEEYVKTMIEKDIAKNVEMQIITNGTFSLSETWKKALSEFAHIELTFSIDGTDDNYDYIRTGAKFEDVITNTNNIIKTLATTTKSFALDYAYCLQGLNAHKFKYDETFFQNIRKESKKYENFRSDNKFVPNVITHPAHLSLSVLHPLLVNKYELHQQYSGFEYITHGLPLQVRGIVNLWKIIILKNGYVQLMV
jgi:organic radical activating enzyme